MKTLLLISLAGLLYAQDEKLASVKGVVVNSITGQPLNKATVTLQSKDGTKSQSATASGAGEFEFKRLDPGSYTVFAVRQGFVVSGKSNATIYGKVLALAAGEKLTAIKLMLAPQGVIAGRVLDSDGEPLQHIQVQAFRRNWTPGQPGFVPGQGAMTNDLGEYRISDLPAGRYYVRSMFNQVPGGIHFGPEDSPKETYPSLFSPGVLDRAQAQPVDVAAGVVRQGIDIRMFKVASRRVRGKVVLEEGGDLQQTPLFLAPQSGEEFGGGSGAQINKDGTFEFQNVLPGSYFIASFTQTTHALLPIEVRDKDVGEVVVRLRPGFTVTAKIHWDGEAPPDSAVSKLRVGLEALVNFGMQSEEGKDSFIFKNVVAGRGRLSVSAPQGSYVKAIRYGDQELEDEEIEIVEGAELEIVLRQGSGSFEGTVELDDTPVPDTSVLLVPVLHKVRQSLYELGVTDQNGHVKIENVTPGEYDAYAFESIEHGSWLDPEFAAKWARRAERIKIEEKSHESKKLALIKSSGQ